MNSSSISLQSTCKTTSDTLQLTSDVCLDGNLSVSNSLALFCSNGVNHALEKETNSMKIQGGIKGVGNNESAVEEYFLI